MNGKSSSPMKVFFCIGTNKENGENRRKKKPPDFLFGCPSVHHLQSLFHFITLTISSCSRLHTFLAIVINGYYKCFQKNCLIHMAQPFQVRVDHCVHGSSGLGSSSSSSPSVFFLNSFFVTNAMDAVPTIAHAIPIPIATARPED